MLMRNGFLGLMLLIALSAAALAAPPNKPLIEGRETDPVAREYYQGEKPAERPGNAPALPSSSKGEWVDMPNSWTEIVADACQVLLCRIIFPLEAW
jgi:hypothetical protein